MGIGLAILFAKSHGSQPEGADFKRTVWDTVILHSQLPFLFIRSGIPRQRSINMAEGEKKEEVKNQKKPGDEEGAVGETRGVLVYPDSSQKTGGR
ncbi:hypothetical protein LN650_06565 [Klebsiella pneumoniae subsp. pneumoniae]|nr:hypothetical protein [Klebsiella pneumoniae subsp. pneumoniae]